MRDILTHGAGDIPVRKNVELERGERVSKFLLEFGNEYRIHGFSM